ncbi:vacuolar protein sorting-associated protein 13, partial [Suillus paluster]|uniref:vacuolar protein sorting-associated protein 13 n=1 Tax=Suillus paluster TaxID=48578 RepID=UPI001B87411C
LLRFAAQAIMDRVCDRRRKLTWAYFAERRDDRNKYLELFEKKMLNSLRESDIALLNALECKLSYEDIRFYRSIARSRLRKDMESRKILEEAHTTQQQQQSGGWMSWPWGSQTDRPKDNTAFGGQMTEEQPLFEVPRDALKTRVVAEIKKGSFALKVDPKGSATEVISTVFDSFRAEVIQRPDNFEASVSLGGFGVFDGATKDSLYRQVVRVKTSVAEGAKAIKNGGVEDPFFFVKFESKPLDKRADTALTARLRHMEIIYHKGYVEAIFMFLRRPECQLGSVELLLNVASQSLEGLRKRTRAGLEYALQTHKTIDLQLDITAPIIIFPEDVTTLQCSHLVIDAGHIAIKSDLTDKSALREIHAKRNQSYSEDDYKRLESLMYDKVSLKLQAAQVVLGNDLQAYRDALTSEKGDTLHLLERINFSLQVQNSIVPSAVNLARFKISGHLPSLQVNVSDAKYKALMGIVDVTIPHFDEVSDQKPPQTHIDTAPLVSPWSAELFELFGTEYNVDDDEADNEAASIHRNNLFFEASDSSFEHFEIWQHIFELDFEIDTLRGAISKSSSNGSEEPLGEVVLQQFRLTFSLLKFNMNLDINLRSLTMNVAQANRNPIQLVSSENTESVEDMLTFSYKRVQKNSPEFDTVYQSVDQSIDIQLSTFIFHAAPEPVVSLYDFIMPTFVPQVPDQPTNKSPSTPAISSDGELSPPASSNTRTIRLAVRLDNMKFMLLDGFDSLSTLSVSTADAHLFLRTNTMRITGRLGGPCVHFLEQPLHDIYLFVTKLAKLYDFARVQFDVSVKTSAIVFPSDPSRLQDVLVMRLGEISARNSHEADTSRITASLCGIQLVSDLVYNGESSMLKIADDIDISHTQIAVKISDVKLYLTQTQYILLMKLAHRNAQAESSLPVSSSDRSGISSNQGIRVWTTVDFVASSKMVELHLYDGLVTCEESLEDHGIAHFDQAALKSFTISNTRPGRSAFREVIPAADHGRNQIAVLYTTSGNSSMYHSDEFFTNTFQQDIPADIENASTAESQRELPQSRLDFRLDLRDLSVDVLENDEDANSQAIRLYIDQILLSQQGILALTVNQLRMSLIRMGADADTSRFLDSVDLTFSMDGRSSTREQMTSMELAAKPIIFRASFRDITLITTIARKTVDIYSTKSAQLAYKGPSQTSRSTRSHRQTIRQAVMSKEQLKVSFDGLCLILIGDLHEQPMIHLKIKPFIVEARYGSADLRATATLATQVSYWNWTNSHWEPYQPSSELKVSVSARERLDLNVSTAFAELAVTSANMWGKEGQVVLQKARGSFAPYRIRNRTGSPLFVWSDDDVSRDSKDPNAVKIANDQTVDWRFEDWKTMHEHVSTSQQHHICIHLVGKPWEILRGIPVDREGDFTFSLRPRTGKYADRVMCSVSIEDSAKIVTLRSTYLVENQTFYPLEIMLVDHTGHPVYSLERIAPGQDYSLPIEAVTQNSIQLQPDQTLGYRWCTSIRFEDLTTKKSLTISCPCNDQRESPFRFQAWAQSDSNESGTYTSPKIKLKLRAPIELENLLPCNIQYRIYDKDADQNWKSYLRKGGVMPVHSVELGHLVLLNVDVQDTIFKPSDFAVINTGQNSDFEVESRLSLRDQSNRKLDLRLNYVRYPESGGAFKLQIYCPYLVINKTGLPFGVKAAQSHRAISFVEIAADTRSDVISKPIPFLLSHPRDNGQAFVFKVGESGWSKVFSLEAPCAETEMVIPSSRQNAEEFHIGLSWTEGLGKYKLTKVMTLAPRFLIKNNLLDPIYFREYGAAPKGRAILHPGERCPLQIMHASQEKLLTIAYSELNSQWSAPINIEDLGSVHLRVQLPNNDIYIVQVDVKIDGSTIFVILSAAEAMPFVIENDSDFSVSMMQWDPSREDADAVKSSAPQYKLGPHSSMPYAWDQPAVREKKIMLVKNDSHHTVDIMEMGVLMPFKFHDCQRIRAVSLDVRPDGHRQILRITPYVAERSIYKPKHLSSSSWSRPDTMTSSSEGFEAIMEDVSPTLTFDVEFAGIAISLVNRRMVEVVYISVEALKFEYSNGPAAQSVNLSCDSLQIDNQLHDALYPVILQPSPISKEASGIAVLPTIQGSVVWLTDQEHGVLFVKYCSVLLQALTIEADEDLLLAIYDLTQIQGVSWEENAKDVLIQHPEEIPEPQLSAAGQDVYFEVLELQPIQLSLSFMRTERVSSEEKPSIRNPLAVIINALTMTLGNVNDAQLELNALAIKDMRLTMPELQARITYHYRQDILRQLYRILGSADFIGNPIGLFTNVSSGVSDIFYAPYHGVVMHGNRGLGIGIAKGATSFVKKTVFGLSDSMTKFTSSVGKGLSAATLDSGYQAQRRTTQRRNRPRHAIAMAGIVVGLFHSTFLSLCLTESCQTKPIQGAEAEGALGFFKGVGKGVVGAVTKPAIGIFDFASNLSEGIRNTTTVFDKPERDRIRLPRHVPPDGILVPFSAREALGQYWMRDLNNGAFRKEAYVAHIESPGSENTTLLTSSRVLSFSSKKLRLAWDLPMTMVQGVAVEDTGIRFTHKSGKDHDKVVFIPDRLSQTWFFGQITSVVKAFNNRRRMDA